ncbi:MAG: hypothetical protein D6784_18590, partial [Chloroflexi bacterium]
MNAQSSTQTATEQPFVQVWSDCSWWVKKWDVPSASRPGQSYRVSMNKNGGWGCTCPQWKYRRQECRHIRLVRENADLNAEPEPVTTALLLKRRLGQVVEVL